MGTLIDIDEVNAARARIAAKREKFRKAKEAKEVTIKKAKEAKEVTIKVQRKPHILGQFVQVIQNQKILKIYYIHSKIKGDFATVKECIQSLKTQEFDIVNLPREDDTRFYAKQLFCLGGCALGVICNDGSHRECYTIDDLLESGFL